MTKEEFKNRWDSDNEGGGITFDDIATCAISWGLCLNPKTKPIMIVRDMVLKEAGCVL